MHQPYSRPHGQIAKSVISLIAGMWLECDILDKEVPNKTHEGAEKEKK